MCIIYYAYYVYFFYLSKFSNCAGTAAGLVIFDILCIVNVPSPTTATAIFVLSQRAPGKIRCLSSHIESIIINYYRLVLSESLQLEEEEDGPVTIVNDVFYHQNGKGILCHTSRSKHPSMEDTGMTYKTCAVFRRTLTMMN